MTSTGQSNGKYNNAPVEMLQTYPERMALLLAAWLVCFMLSRV